MSTEEDEQGFQTYCGLVRQGLEDILKEIEALPDDETRREAGALFATALVALRDFIRGSFGQPSIGTPTTGVN